MSEDCTHEEATVTLTLNFEVCTSHGMARPTGSMLEAHGVAPQNFLPLILGVVEETLTLTMTEDGKLREFLERPYADGDVLSIMTEREQKRIARLLAHQYLLRQVADRTYAIAGTEGALLSLPFDPSGG